MSPTPAIALAILLLAGIPPAGAANGSEQPAGSQEFTSSAQAPDPEASANANEPTTRALAAYESGDVESAQRLFLQAARAGDALAAYNAAVIRLNEESAEPGEQAAVELLLQSAQAGFGPAQHMLATLYEGGRFVPRPRCPARLRRGRALVRKSRRKRRRRRAVHRRLDVRAGSRGAGRPRAGPHLV